MEKQQALEKVNGAYAQVNAFVRRHPHESATTGTGLTSLLIDTLFFHTNLYGIAFGVAVTYGVWQWGQRDIVGVQGRVVESAPPMGRIDQQKSEYTFKERLWRLFDRDANGPDQPRKQGIMKDEREPRQDAPLYYCDEMPRLPASPGNTQQQQRQAKRPLPVVDPRFSAPMDMADILKKGFRPTRSTILLMNSPKGYVTEAINKLHHIGLAGASGRGKTNTTRLIVSQLLACEAKVYMINPNFAPVKQNGTRLEDWRPIEARLQQPVARNKPEIAKLLAYFMQIFKQRREREQVTPKRGADLFLVIGEWPVVVEEYPEAVAIIGRLLRQARQYGIHVVAEFQDALIGTIKGNSGTRANYGTTYFFGGDLTTARALLNPPEGVKIDNTGLGDKGAVYLKSFSADAVEGRVPFFSNAALYMLLGCIGEPVTDEEVDEDSFYEDEDDEDIDIEGTLARMPDVRDEYGNAYEDEDEENDGDIYRASRTTMRMPELPGRCNDPKPLVPIIPDKGRKAEDLDMNTVIKVWNNVQPSIKDLEEIFDLTNHQAQKLRKMILARNDARPERAID